MSAMNHHIHIVGEKPALDNPIFPTLKKWAQSHPDVFMQKNEIVFRQCGLFSIQGNLHVVLPQSYQDKPLPTGERGFKEILLLFRACTLYWKFCQNQERVSANKHPVVFQETNKGKHQQNVLKRLEVMLSLLLDFQEHGAMVMAEPSLKQGGKGRIAWRETIEKSHPISAKGGTIYKGIYRKRVHRDPQHELARLYRFTVSQIAQHLGYSEPRSQDLFLRSEIDDILRQYDGRIFHEHHRQRHIWLCQYYQGCQQQSTRSQHSEGIFVQFTYLWEHMLQTVLEHEEDIIRPYHGRYIQSQKQGLRIQPDVVLFDTEKEAYLIVDAKNYKPGSLPSSDALCKQILYRFLLFESDPILKDSHTGNVMAFPYCGTSSLQIFDTHALDSRSKWGTILCVHIDVPTLFKAYIIPTKGQFFRQQLCDIFGHKCQ